MPCVLNFTFQWEQLQPLSWPKAGEAKSQNCPPMLFQQGAKHTLPQEQAECSPTLSCPESPQVYFSPLVYCTISAELHAHNNLVFHSSLNVSTDAKNIKFFITCPLK